MQFSLESLSALATIAGTLIAVFALVQTSAWLVLMSLAFVCVSIGVGLYARQTRIDLNSASTVIEGRSIDSLNMANLRRRVNRTFVIQEAHHTALVNGEDLEVTWRYKGFCRIDNASSMEFSIDSEGKTEFGDLNCFAFDLGRDPQMEHRIRPILIGTEGVSKKISVPLLEPLRVNEHFSLLLRCTLPGCLTSGFGYYTSTLSFAQDRVARCVVNLVFSGSAPRWVRVYESSPKRSNELVKTLPLYRQEQGLHEYLDVVEGRAGQSARVYTFWRDPL